MPTYSIRRFADPDALRRLRPRYLLTLLRPHADYFAGRTLVFPSSDEGEIDYETLSGILLNPDDRMPKPLVDTLYYINEMATEDGMDKLLAAAEAAGLTLDAGAEVSPADVAVQVWLKDPSLLERSHAQGFLARLRSYQSFQSTECPGPACDPSPTALAALETDLDDWFEKKKRGRGCRIFPFARADGVWFLVRHGQPFKREGSLEAGEPGSIYYRPVKHDIVVYLPDSGELRVNAVSKGEKDLYSAKFGLHLFGREDHFLGAAMYTLDPLRDDGDAALACTDIEGMEWVKLTEIRYFWKGTPFEIEIRRSDDLFAVMARRNGRIPSGPSIIGAKFLAKFADAKVARSVSIRPPNTAEYTRDDDGMLVAQWLSKRGFILAEQEDRDEKAEPILAGA